MYSGSDSADSQKYSQWPINAPGYQNSSSDHVDWAALAQQWIIMKEAGPPPIPGGQLVNIQKEVDGRKKDLNEGGEAPMDVENEKEEQTTWNAPGNSVTVDGIAPPPPPPPGTETWNAWNSTGNANWNWSNTWNSPSVVPPPVKPPLLPTPEAFSGPPDSASDNAVPFRAPGSNNFSPGFWTGMGVGKVTQTEIKPHNKRYSKVNVPTKVTIITPPVSNTSTVTSVTEAIAVPVAAPVTTPTIDANKRKQLPAWIREGLEKMEKDKQKQLEKEREKHAREEFTEKIKQEEKEKMEILKREVMQRSKFVRDSDNERSDSEETVKRKSPTMQSVPLTAEELMTKVRKAMTEILLKVTNQQIAEICQEERQRYLKKKRASDHLASAPSGAILSAKLGLGVYNDDDDDSNSSRDTDGDSQRNDDDSDLELKESILRRQTEFSKTERQIELRLAEAQGKKIRDKSVSSGSESDDHSQTDTRADSASWRNASDSEKRRAGGSTSSSGSSNYLNSKCRSRRRSSSSDSSGRRDKSRSESSERSRRADRRRRSRSRSSKRSNKRRRSSSDSPYSRRSQRSRSRSKSSYSSRRSTKMSRRSSRSRSRPRDRKRSSHRSRRSKSRSRSYRGSFRRSVSSPRRNHSSSRRDRSRSRRRRSSRSSSRGKRSHRR